MEAHLCTNDVGTVFVTPDGIVWSENAQIYFQIALSGVIFKRVDTLKQQ